MEGFTIPGLGLILLIASLVAMISRRARLPYSVGLVAAGVALAFLPAVPQMPLSRDLIFEIFLPPLIFEAALQMQWRTFRRELALTLTLAFVGVPVAAALVAAGMHYALGWSWIGAALFGMLIAATDPVAVIASFKEMKAPKRLAMVVESESLLNDGAAAVGFILLVAMADGSTMSGGGIAASAVWVSLGGIACGAAVAGAILLLAGRTNDKLVEITLTTIAAFGSFMLAEGLGASGVLASLAAGLIVGNVGWMGSISDEGREHVLSFWIYVAFLANSVIFILIGMHTAVQPFALFTFPAALAIGLVLLGRAVAVYPLSALFARSELKLDWPCQHILFWGGLRGALALALALAVPASVPERFEIIVVAFAVVAFSILVQGLTMPWLMRRLGLERPDDEPD
jgi:CPA1 family monovalent cation:H+ antiporter